MCHSAGHDVTFLSPVALHKRTKPVATAAAMRWLMSPPSIAGGGGRIVILIRRACVLYKI